MSMIANIPIPASFLDVLPHPALLVCEEGKVVYRNDMAQKAFGWDQVAGGSVYHLLSSGEGLKLRQALSCQIPENGSKIDLAVSGKHSFTEAQYTVGIAAHPVKDPFYFLLSFQKSKPEPVRKHQSCHLEAAEEQEDALHASAFLKYSIDGVFAFDTDFKFKVWNPYMEKLTGLPEQHVLGRTILQVLPYYNGDPEYHFFEQALKGEPFIMKGRKSRFSPDLFHDGYLFPIRDTRQQVVGAICIMHEVTQQMLAEEEARGKSQLLQEAQTHAQSILQNSPIAIFTFSPELEVTSWNPAMETLSGIPAHHIIGKTTAQAYPHYHNSSIESELKTVLLGKRLQVLKFKSQAQDKIVNVFAQPLLDPSGVVKGGLCYLQDVTEQVKLEEKNAAAAKEQQLAVMQAVLQAQEEEKKRMAEMLHNNVGQTLYATGMRLKQYLATQNLNKKHKAFLTGLEEMVTDAIADTKKISFELMPSLLQDFGLKVALEELASKIVPLTMQIKLDIDPGQKRCAPKLEICVYRIVQELMNNVVRHSGATFLSVTVTKTTRQVDIQVQDNGVGYVHAPKSRRSGTGLLSIQNRVSTQGGTCIVISKPGQGTTTKITLPLKAR
ncbi:PAS domain-containing protein [Nibribacter ruber]|uniref:histidine kinase n=1 Tax=Nibribacter ruber TaxID=2698458 RepID=A0A6P1NUX4_9BACT|nr:PAS domain-containing protein [Nibribacter ruber]QHL86134.1 PAS domain-containing protein [Nibribacter ruber]